MPTSILLLAVVLLVFWWVVSEHRRWRQYQRASERLAHLEAIRPDSRRHDWLADIDDFDWQTGTMRSGRNAS